MKNISILGATGSIGEQTLDVIRNQKKDFSLIAVAANTNYNKIIDIINEFDPKYVSMMDEISARIVNDYCRKNNLSIEVMSGMDGLTAIASLESVDMVVTSLVGMVGLLPTLCAIRQGKDIAIANKETLVVAGELVMREAEKNKVKILPVDSEHSAIFQCIHGNNIAEVSKIILTASGGPFRGRTMKELQNIPYKEALKHPNWSMGKKISIDSATMMNKGLEVIEAHWLFGKEFDDIDVVVHPQSIIHSMIEYCDGSVVAQLGNADMRLPIQYALNYPKRRESIVHRLSLTSIGKLTFEEPDRNTFKCLDLAYYAGKEGKLMPTILNGANEACVDMYIKGIINFSQIPCIIEECMNKFTYDNDFCIDNIIQTDAKVKEYILKKYN
jgi:1-deoxy-D-xylulose-5-phosphate reductoisomerase